MSDAKNAVKYNCRCSISDAQWQIMVMLKQTPLFDSSVLTRKRKHGYACEAQKGVPQTDIMHTSMQTDRR